jgi:UDP-GlcNAc:undecaprenyl-phosphate GlcNAc-1-phosphate transferase
MNESHLALSGFAFAFSLLLGLGGMSLAYSLGHRFGMVSHPRLFGRGAPAVSHLGGAALAASVLGVILPLLLLTHGLLKEVGALMAGALTLMVLGLVDDKVRVGGLSPYLRLMVEASVAAAVWWAGVRATPTGNNWIDACLTVFFLVAATNAFNLLDNMDGVAGACAATIAAGLFALAGLSGQYLVAILAAATVGASLAFLRHNFVNARVYLGNAGSMFLGFLIAAATLKLRLPLSQPSSYMAAIAVLAVPVADTSLVIISRWTARRPLLTGGVDHLSHRLVLLGLSTKASALAHCLASAVGATMVAFAVVLHRNTPVVFITALFAALTLLLLRVAVYETDPPEAIAGDTLAPVGALGEGSLRVDTLPWVTSPPITHEHDH